MSAGGRRAPFKSDVHCGWKVKKRVGPDATHGDGGSDSDDGTVPSVSLASFAGSKASCIPGDMDDDEAEQIGEVLLAPDFSNEKEKREFTDGDWEASTRDDGDQTLRQENIGTFGILCGNWGGQRKSPKLVEHMNFDLKSSSCAIIMLQEAKQELLDHLKAPRQDGISERELSLAVRAKRPKRRRRKDSKVFLNFT